MEVCKKLLEVNFFIWKLSWKLNFRWGTITVVDQRKGVWFPRENTGRFRTGSPDEPSSIHRWKFTGKFQVLVFLPGTWSLGKVHQVNQKNRHLYPGKTSGGFRTGCKGPRQRPDEISGPGPGLPGRIRNGYRNRAWRPSPLPGGGGPPA